VALASAHDAKLWIVWASQKDGSWHLFGRTYANEKFDAVKQISQGHGPHLWHRMTSDSKGRVWLVWQGILKAGRSAVHVYCYEGGKWGEVLPGAGVPHANQWAPTIAADATQDRVWIGWDEHDGANFGVRVMGIFGEDKKAWGYAVEKSPL